MNTIERYRTIASIEEGLPAAPAQPALTKSQIYAAAERKMQRGKRLVMSGFVVSVVGIIGYCATCFTAGVNQDLGSALLDNPAWLVGPALGVIGLGTLLWLVGSFVYLSGEMDSDPSGPDLYR